MKPAAGVIGLGIMGGAIARHISQKGFNVFGYDISKEASVRASANGVTLTTSVAGVAQNSKIVVCSLPSALALKEVADEIAASVSNKCILVEASTFTISDKEKARDILESAGHTLLDCPVSGTGQQAKTGDLAVFTSGHKASVDECLPVIEAFSRENTYCGPFGAGSKMKFVANHLITVHNTAAAEAMVLGMKSGLEPALIFDVISTSAATSRMFQVRGKMMSENNYDEIGMSNRLYQKDLDIISAFAAEVGCPVSLFMAAVQPYRATLAQGLGEKDTAAVCAVLEEQARVER